MSNTVEIKQGDTFSCTWTWTPGDSGPTDLLDTTVTSSVKVCRTTYALTVTVAEDGLSFTTAYDGSTATWETGTHAWDIKFVFPSGTTHSETFRFTVLEAVTA